MSELIAEARVLVTPDTTAFRSLLISQTTAAAAGVTVPVAVTPTITGGGTAAQAAGLVSAQQSLAGAADLSADALRREQALLAQGGVLLDSVAIKETAAADAIRGSDAARKQAAASTAAYARNLRGLSTGAGSAGLSLVGLRGATLAANAPFLAGAAGIIAFTGAVKTFAGFEEQLNVFQVTAGATADEMDRVAEASRRLGADVRLPGVSASDAALAMTEFAKAGLTVNESIAATPGGLQLAAAAGLDYASAVNLTASALNAFNLEGNEAVHVADVLANAANNAPGGIADTALALRQAAGAAAVVGVSFEDTSALLTLLARNGLVGSDAGTALRTAFIRLVNPSKEAQAILAKLNVSLRDINGNVRPEVFADFAEAQRNLSKAQQQANAAVVFGQDAFRAFGFLGREGVAGFNEVSVALGRQGTASEIAAARAKGLAGEMRSLQSNIETFGLTVGEVAAPAVEGFASGLNRVFTGLNLAAEAARDFLTNDFDVPAANIRKLTTELTNLDQEVARFKQGGGDDTIAQGILADGDADAIEARILKIAKRLRETPQGVSELQEAFANASPTIRAALIDGIVTPLEQAEIATTSLGRAFLKAFKLDAVSGITTFLQDAFGGLVEDAESVGKEAGAAFSAGFKQTAKLDLDLAVARAGGDESEELSLLRTRETRQDDFLNAVLKREQNPKNVQLAIKAANNLDQTRAQIETIVSGQQAKAKSAADKVIADASKADQIFLEGLATARTNQQNLIAAAANTEGAADDIARNVTFRALVQRQIEQIRNSGAAEKTKQAAIQALTAAVIATTGTIQRLRDAERDQREANRQAIFDRTAENADLRIQIAEARGNKDAVIQLLDARIRLAQQAVARAKKAKEGVLKAILAVEELRKKRRELLKEAGEGDGGTTAFDLLTQAAERFTGGNIIGANQPFAGPTEFTADISQFLRRNSATTTGGANVSVRNEFQGFQGGIDRLVTALEANTNALTGGEAGPPVRKGKRPPVSGAIDRNDRRWRDSAQARETIEGAG